MQSLRYHKRISEDPLPRIIAERMLYVANNAVKHGIVKHRRDYPWTYVAPEYESIFRITPRHCDIKLIMVLDPFDDGKPSIQLFQKEQVRQIMRCRHLRKR